MFVYCVVNKGYMNKIVVSGNVGDAPEVKTVGNSKVLSFRLADEVGYGENKAVQWYTCQIWGKRAEGQLIDFIKKGMKVTVYGSLKIRTFKLKDGSSGSSNDISVDEVSLPSRVESKTSDEVPF